ncbi:hypothetical protein A4G20_06665 [Pasteurellaceae bacterium RH1A]|nr:hypothetical protein A4G20_06665 [Pasteurellaceae bacterium RH1A]
MQLIIFNNSVNGYNLGEVYSKDALLNQEIFFEFDKGKSQRLIAISAKSIKEFYLNNKKITFDNFENFLEKNSVLIENHIHSTHYIFKEYNICIVLLSGYNYFAEVLIYDESIKELYENNLAAFSSDIYKKPQAFLKIN